MSRGEASAALPPSAWPEISKWTEFAEGKLEETAGRSPVIRCDACGGPMKVIAVATGGKRQATSGSTLRGNIRA